MLNENEENIKQRTPRIRKPSRWDAVMNKIEENKQNVRVKSGYRSGVRSKVFSNLQPSRSSSPAPETSSDKNKQQRHPLRELASPAPSNRQNRKPKLLSSPRPNSANSEVDSRISPSR